MTTGFSNADLKPQDGDETCIPGASIADVLRLLSAGATGAILMALGEGPLRTKNLTERVPGYAPRTIYRYAGKLAELEVIEREEEPGVPSKVVHTLTDPCGSELYELVNRFADASLTRLPDGRIDAHAWASLGLLADLWETGMMGELSGEARSPTDLSRGAHGLSYHQVNRRAGLFKASGLLSEWQGEGRRRCYGLTEKARRKMGLVIGIGRWRHHHVVGEGEVGISAAEMATALRAAFPLVELPGHRGRCLQLSVLAEGEEAGAEGEAVWLEVAEGDVLQSCGGTSGGPDGWARGKVATWVPAVLDGDAQKLLVGGEEGFVSKALEGIYETLWTPSIF